LYPLYFINFVGIAIIVAKSADNEAIVSSHRPYLCSLFRPKIRTAQSSGKRNLITTKDDEACSSANNAKRSILGPPKLIKPKFLGLNNIEARRRCRENVSFLIAEVGPFCFARL
jgi:hypothetical protein